MSELKGGLQQANLDRAINPSLITDNHLKSAISPLLAGTPPYKYLKKFRKLKLCEGLEQLFGTISSYFVNPYSNMTISKLSKYKYKINFYPQIKYQQNMDPKGSGISFPPAPKQITVSPEIKLRRPERGDAQTVFQAIDENRAFLKKYLVWVDFTKCAEDSEKFIEKVSQEMNKLVSLH